MLPRAGRRPGLAAQPREPGSELPAPYLPRFPPTNPPTERSPKVSSLLLATVLQASLSILGAENDKGVDVAKSYAEAHRTITETGKPMVIMVSAPWCAPCQEMKKNVLPQCLRRGLFRRVTFCIVDAEREDRLAEKLTDGGPVPQLIMYRKTPRGWLRRALIGGQDLKEVERVVSEGVAADEAD